VVVSEQDKFNLVLVEDWMQVRLPVSDRPVGQGRGLERVVEVDEPPQDVWIILELLETVYQVVVVCASNGGVSSVRIEGDTEGVLDSHMVQPRRQEVEQLRESCVTSARTIMVAPCWL
jgi:hypothetical protein